MLHRYVALRVIGKGSYGCAVLCRPFPLESPTPLQNYITPPLTLPPFSTNAPSSDKSAAEIAAIAAHATFTGATPTRADSAAPAQLLSHSQQQQQHYKQLQQAQQWLSFSSGMLIGPGSTITGISLERNLSTSDSSVTTSDLSGVSSKPYQSKWKDAESSKDSAASNNAALHEHGPPQQRAHSHDAAGDANDGLVVIKLIQVPYKTKGAYMPTKGGGALVQEDMLTRCAEKASHVNSPPNPSANGNSIDNNTDGAISHACYVESERARYEDEDELNSDFIAILREVSSFVACSNKRSGSFHTTNSTPTAGGNAAAIRGHPNVVGYLDSFITVEGALAIVMQYCNGGDLTSMIAQQVERRKLAKAQAAKTKQQRETSDERLSCRKDVLESATASASVSASGLPTFNIDGNSSNCSNNTVANTERHTAAVLPGYYFPETVCWDIICQLMLGVVHIHNRKILHRDLKTSNVFLHNNMLAHATGNAAACSRSSSSLAGADCVSKLQSQSQPPNDVQLVAVSCSKCGCTKQKQQQLPQPQRTSVDQIELGAAPTAAAASTTAPKLAAPSLSSHALPLMSPLPTLPQSHQQLQSQLQSQSPAPQLTVRRRKQWSLPPATSTADTSSINIGQHNNSHTSVADTFDATAGPSYYDLPQSQATHSSSVSADHRQAVFSSVVHLPHLTSNETLTPNPIRPETLASYDHSDNNSIANAAKITIETEDVAKVPQCEHNKSANSDTRNDNNSNGCTCSCHKSPDTAAPDGDSVLQQGDSVISQSGLTLLIGDFGVSRPLAATAALALTRIGTPYYLSPEVIKGQPYSFPSDVWALGVIAYEILQLKRPFRAASLPALAIKIIKGKPRPLHPGYSERLRGVVSGMLEKLPQKRLDIKKALRAVP